MNEEVFKHNLSLLFQLVRHVVAERYKHMVRDEVLSRFMSFRVDPAVLVDLSLQLERESIHLTEVSLLKLVTPDKMKREIERTAQRIQQAYQDVFGEENEIVNNFLTTSLLLSREASLRTRVELYNPFLALHEKAQSPIELMSKAFNSLDRIQRKLEAQFEADRRYAEEIIKATEPLHRFLMKKQTDYETSKAESVWGELVKEAFKKPQALP